MVPTGPAGPRGLWLRQKGPSGNGKTWTTSRRDGERKKEGNIAAAAAAVAVSAPLRVTLEGAHRRTVAQATGAPVTLKHLFNTSPVIITNIWFLLTGTVLALGG